MIYDMANMKLLHTIHATSHPAAPSALSPSSDACYLAYLNTNAITGKVILFDAETLTAVNVIEAHKSGISRLAFSFDGRMLATASDKGTVLRVFSVPEGGKKCTQLITIEKLFQFRRGSMQAKIHSLAFSASGELLAVCSDTDTIHIFRLGVSSTPSNSPANKNKELGSKRTSFGYGIQVIGSILSPYVSSILL
jgi:autophagy-related protein 18